jgi:hypothetical protein
MAATKGAVLGPVELHIDDVLNGKVDAGVWLEFLAGLAKRRAAASTAGPEHLEAVLTHALVQLQVRSSDLASEMREAMRSTVGALPSVRRGLSSSQSSFASAEQELARIGGRTSSLALGHALVEPRSASEVAPLRSQEAVVLQALQKVLDPSEARMPDYMSILRGLDVIKRRLELCSSIVSTALSFHSTVSEAQDAVQALAADKRDQESLALDSQAQSALKALTHAVAALASAPGGALRARETRHVMVQAVTCWSRRVYSLVRASRESDASLARVGGSIGLAFQGIDSSLHGALCKGLSWAVAVGSADAPIGHLDRLRGVCKPLDRLLSTAWVVSRLLTHPLTFHSLLRGEDEVERELEIGHLHGSDSGKMLGMGCMLRAVRGDASPWLEECLGWVDAVVEGDSTALDAAVIALTRGGESMLRHLQSTVEWEDSMLEEGGAGTQGFRRLLRLGSVGRASEWLQWCVRHASESMVGSGDGAWKRLEDAVKSRPSKATASADDEEADWLGGESQQADSIKTVASEVLRRALDIQQGWTQLRERHSTLWGELHAETDSLGAVTSVCARQSASSVTGSPPGSLSSSGALLASAALSVLPSRAWGSVTLSSRAPSTGEWDLSLSEWTSRIANKRASDPLVSNALEAIKSLPSAAASSDDHSSECLDRARPSDAVARVAEHLTEAAQWLRPSAVGKEHVGMLALRSAVEQAWLTLPLEGVVRCAEIDPSPSIVRRLGRSGAESVNHALTAGAGPDSELGGREFCAAVLSAAVRHCSLTLCERVLQLPSLSAQGVAQLVSDVSRFEVVAASLKTHPHPLLLWTMIAHSMPASVLQCCLDAGGGDIPSGPGRVKRGGAPAPSPSKSFLARVHPLLRVIAMQRGMLVSA